MPTFIAYLSITALMSAAVFPPALGLSVALLAGFAALVTVVSCFDLIYNNQAKKHLFEEIAREPTPYASNNHGFFNSAFSIACETSYNLCDLPKIIGLKP